MSLHLSPARIELFVDCPRCFWLRVNEGLERPSGPFPSLPSGMDAAIKEHFDRHRRAGTVPPSVADATGGRLYPDQDDLDRCRSWQTEPSYPLPDSDVVLRGGVDDLLELPSGEITVLDYKTRSSAPEAVPAYYRRQLALYSLILAAGDYDVADHGYLLYYHPDGVGDEGAATFATAVERVPVDTGRAERTVVDAVETLNGPRPAPDDDCAYCDYVAERG